MRSRCLLRSQSIIQVAGSLIHVRIDAIIEDLRADEEDHIPHTDTDESRVSGMV